MGPVGGMTRDDLIGLVERIMRAEGETEEGVDALIELFESSVSRPEASDLIFWPEQALGPAHRGRELTAAEVVDIAMAYRAIAL